MAKFATTLKRRKLDEHLRSYRGLPKPPARGYLRDIRNALEMSSYQLASLLGVSQPSVIELEMNEQRGSISLKTLERAANAMGCKLVYALVPKTSLEETVIEQARAQAEELSKTVFRTMALEKQSTTHAEKESLIATLSEEIMRKGGQQLWKKHGH
ncbi:MAG: mobile mystery protein A [Candidatus Obscuribacterales bacterium]|nr:mobile mystery protein A [Candidatus Obscuribacterales bacterium]